MPVNFQNRFTQSTAFATLRGLVAMRSWLWVLLLWAGGVAGAGKQTVVLRLQLTYGAQLLQAGKWYALPGQTDSVQFSMVKFYLSDLQFEHNGTAVKSKGPRYLLADMDDSTSLNYTFTLPAKAAFNALAFNSGIDSATNAAGAMGGSLDPTRGMYWTWQSGYINFKLEGSSPVCAAAGHVFRFHTGGYRYPYNNVRHIKLACRQQSEVVLTFDVQQLFFNLNLQQQYEVMSPGNSAMYIADLIAAAFKTSP